MSFSVFWASGSSYVHKIYIYIYKSNLKIKKQKNNEDAARLEANFTIKIFLNADPAYLFSLNYCHADTSNLCQ